MVSVGVGRSDVWYWMLDCIARSSRRGERAMRCGRESLYRFRVLRLCPQPLRCTEASYPVRSPLVAQKLLHAIYCQGTKGKPSKPGIFFPFSGDN